MRVWVQSVEMMSMKKIRMVCSGSKREQRPVEGDENSKGRRDVSRL